MLVYQRVGRSLLPTIEGFQRRSNSSFFVHEGQKLRKDLWLVNLPPPALLLQSKAPPKRTWTVPRAPGLGFPRPPSGMRCARRSGEGRRNGSVVQPCWKWKRPDVWREGRLMRILEIICLLLSFHDIIFWVLKLYVMFKS